jgi:hypothetical protein
MNNTEPEAKLHRFKDGREEVLLVQVGDRWHCSDAAYEYRYGGPWPSFDAAIAAIDGDNT